MRCALVVALILTFAGSSTDLAACGDKFLRVGRSVRFKRYAAVYPASILIYKPVNATPAGIKEFETVLKRAGHRPVAVDSGTSLPRALAAAQYDVVIADYGDAVQIRNEVQSVSPKPELLPILYKPTKAVEAEAERQFACLIKPHAMTKYDALAEIDRLMQLKLKATTASIGK
jgi:hypothetical protein